MCDYVPKGWSLWISSLRQQSSALLITKISCPFTNDQLNRIGVLQGHKDPSFLPHFPRDLFCLSPRRRWKDAVIDQAWKPVQILLTVPPVGTGILVAPPWRSSFFGLRPRRCIFWIPLSFFETFRFRSLSLGRFPLFLNNPLGRAVAQTCILFVPYIPWMLSSERDVYASFLLCPMPQTPHFHWLFDVDRSVLILLILRQYLEVWMSVSPTGLPQR